MFTFVAWAVNPFLKILDYPILSIKLSEAPDYSVIAAELSDVRRLGELY